MTDQHDGLAKTGRCLCGVVTFETTGIGRGLYQCHCSLCRRQSGTASNVATVVPLRSFRWTSGEKQVSTWVKGTGFRSSFCSKCGSPVPNRVGDTEIVWVPAGLLDDASDLRVVAHMHVASAAPWAARPTSGLVYETDPDPAEISAALRDGD